MLQSSQLYTKLKQQPAPVLKHRQFTTARTSAPSLDIMTLRGSQLTYHRIATPEPDPECSPIAHAPLDLSVRVDALLPGR